MAGRGCHGCANEARVAGASPVSSVALAGRMLGVGLRGWYWLLRGRLDKSLVVVQDLLALRPPEGSALLIQLRAVLVGGSFGGKPHAFIAEGGQGPRGGSGVE